MAIGFTLPFSKSIGSVGYLETTNDEISATIQNLKSLLVTNWGDRVMHFYFGCNLVDFLFENRSVEETKIEIADRITSQVATWMPYVNIQEINILLSEDDLSIPDHAMKIRITFGLNSKPNLTSVFEYQVNNGKQ